MEIQIKTARQNFLFVLFAASLAFFLKTYFVFYHTPFQDFVYNDMAAYFQGAFRNNWGNATSIEQFAIFPPFYIYFVALLVKLAFALGASPYALHLPILLNIALYCFSSIFIFSTVIRLTGDKLAAGAAQLFYLFSYTALNLNALILPDNLATPLTVIATGLLVTNEKNIRTICFAGLILGIAIAAKPILAVFGLAFIVYLFFQCKPTRRSHLAAFLVALSLVPLMTIAKNYQVSGGKLLGLGVNGGVNFFQGWGQVGKINSHSGDGDYWVNSPGSREELNWEEITVEEPFYHQGFYYRQGVQAILNEPSVLLKKVFWMKKMFFGDIGPFLPKVAADHPQLMLGYNLLLYLMFVTSLSFLPILTRHALSKDTRLILALILCFFLFVYVMGMPERRYLFYAEYLIIILFFTTVSRLKFLVRIIKDDIWLSALCMTAFFICLPLTIHVINHLTGY